MPQGRPEAKVSSYQPALLRLKVPRLKRVLKNGDCGLRKESPGLKPLVFAVFFAGLKVCVRTRSLWGGLSALAASGILSMGLRPMLVWIAPLAL